jgi:PKD repeat protein
VSGAVTTVILWINVTDEHGMYATDFSDTFSIDCQPPTGTISGPPDEDEDKDVTFSITGASETIATYSWNFGGDGTSTEASPTHRFSDPGDYTITCTITDAYGNSGPATSHTITINEVEEVDFLAQYWWIILIIIIVVILVIILLVARRKKPEEEEESPLEEEEEYEEEEPEDEMEYEEEEVVEEEPEFEEEAAPAAAPVAEPAEEAPAGETKECPSCGTVVPGDATECFLCGATL